MEVTPQDDSVCGTGRFSMICRQLVNELMPLFYTLNTFKFIRDISYFELCSFLERLEVIEGAILAPS